MAGGAIGRTETSELMRRVERLCSRSYGCRKLRRLGLKPGLITSKRFDTVVALPGIGSARGRWLLARVTEYEAQQCTLNLRLGSACER